MINLKFHNLRDKQPEPNRAIFFFVTQNALMMPFGGFDPGDAMTKGFIDYSWESMNSDGEYTGTSICYDYSSDSENAVDIGGKINIEGSNNDFVKEATLWASCQSKQARVLPFNAEADKNKDLEIVWEYAHIVNYHLSKQSGMYKDIFPIEHIEELMKDNLITVDFVKLEDYTNKHGDSYKLIKAFFVWHGIKWFVEGTQEGVWPDDAWTDGKYADFAAYNVEVIK